MEKTAKKIYLVWEGDYDDNANYWSHFDSLEDAVSNYENSDEEPVEVFEATLKLIGEYVSSKVARKARKRK